MPKVKRDPIQEHLVVPDTNILFDGDKKYPVSPDFDAFWNKHLPQIPLELIVPEVVIGELQFQQTTSAIKLASTIRNQTEDLSGVTQSKYRSVLDDTKIKEQISNKLKKWVKSLNGIVASTPIDNIDWSKMVQRAIWREEPFTFDPKDKVNEKGFRDALILETLVNICVENAGNTKNIVFLCNDYLLRTTAEKRLKSNNKVIFFESLIEFESYIQLTQEKLTNEFVKAIQNHARSKFFTYGDKSSVYFKDDIKKKINTQYKSELSLSVDPLNTGTGFFPSTKPSNWQMIDDRWWIGTSRFSSLNLPNEYHWISRVTYTRLISSSVGGGLLAALSPTIELLETFAFDINWRASVKTDGRFHKISVTSISKGDFTRDPPSDEMLTRWKLERQKKLVESSNTVK